MHYYSDPVKTEFKSTTAVAEYDSLYYVFILLSVCSYEGGTHEQKCIWPYCNNIAVFKIKHITYDEIKYDYKIRHLNVDCSVSYLHIWKQYYICGGAL